MEKTIRGITYDVSSSLNPFQLQLHVHLINWKWKHITTEKGVISRGGNQYKLDVLLPTRIVNEYPFLYPPIKQAFIEHHNKYPFKVHEMFSHMAGSQAANVNLFLPVLLNGNRDNILSSIKPDLKRVATDFLDSGYRIEFWDEPYGRLGDKNIASGTDSDIAIAYYNTEDKLCLWLIEHKLTEAEFTECGGYKSKSRNSSHDCSKSFGELIANKDSCYYHSAKRYNYWNITGSNQSFFANAAQFTGCPFRSGLNQLWRNQLLALSIEQDEQQPYEEVWFSVVHHPANISLQHSITEYKRLIADNSRFSVFSSDKILHSASTTNDAGLNDWVNWYKNLYNLAETHAS